MTPKEKARLLVQECGNQLPPRSVCKEIGYPHIHQAKLLAGIVVENSLEAIAQCSVVGGQPLEFWEEVKKEIEKLL